MKTEIEFKKTEIGMVPEDWEIKRITDMVDVTMGQSPPGSAFNNKSEGLFFMQGVRTFGEKYPNFDTFTKIITRRAKKGSVLFSVRAPVGKVNITKEELCIGRGLSVLNMKNKNNEFLYYLLKNYSQHILNFENGSVFGSINKNDIENLELPFPLLPEQKAIAKILSDLDSKIETLQKQNETLENMGQLLFQRWFIDFEFPDGGGGEMIESELGKIPAEWRVDSLDNIANYLNGLALQKYPAKDSKDFLPVIKIRELNQGITDNTDKASLDVPKEYIVENGDILFSWSGSLKVIVWGLGKGALNQHLFKVTSDKYEKWFYYYWTLYHLEKFKIIAESKATTMGHIKREHLRESEVLIPNEKILVKMNKIMNPTIEALINNKIEVQSLTKLRDTLLPKLMSGKVRVK